MEYKYNINERNITENKAYEDFLYENLALFKTGTYRFSPPSLSLTLSVCIAFHVHYKRHDYIPVIICIGEYSPEIGLQTYYLKFPHPKHEENEDVEVTVPIPSNWEVTLNNRH